MNRLIEASWRDHPSLSDNDLTRILSFQQLLGSYVGGHTPILHFFHRASRLWTSKMTLTVLDVQCGGGGLSRRLSRWGQKNNIEFQIMAIDSNARVTSLAEEKCRKYKNISVANKKLNDPLFLQAQQFDYVISEAEMHSLSDNQLESELIIMNRLARRGIALVDYRRDIRALFWMKLLAFPCGNQAVRSAAVSAIRGGLTVEEMRRMCDRTGMKYARVQKELGYRISITGERGLVMSPELAVTPRWAGA